MGVWAAFGKQWRPPDPKAIQEYQEKLYPEWVKSLRKFFSELHDHLRVPNRVAVVNFQVANTGTVPAEHATLTLEALGGVRLAPLPKDGNDSLFDLTMPLPPEAPHGRYTSFPIFDLKEAGGRPVQMSTFAELMPRLPPRDRFHWQKPDDPTRWRADCEEFRHQDAAQTISFLILASDDATPSRGGAIRCTFSARNLPQPVRMTLPVSVTISEGNTGAYATHILHLKRPWHLPVGQSVLTPRPDIHG